MIEPQRAKIHNNYTNTRLRILKANAAVWFNKICKTKQPTPKHFSVKINGNNRKRSVVSYKFIVIVLLVVSLQNIKKKSGHSVHLKASLIMDVRDFKAASRLGLMAFPATTDCRLRRAEQSKLKYKHNYCCTGT